MFFVYMEKNVNNFYHPYNIMKPLKEMRPEN
jgi:hypothetical protein